MMTIDKHNVKEWIERFLNGQTSNIEEQALYRFFATDDIPHNLQKYKAMFDWYAGGMKGELLKAKQKRHLRPLMIRWMTAASILLASGIGLGIYQYQQKEEYDCYEGSYIIRNGEKISDIKQILPELRKTTQLAEQEIKKAESIQNKSAEDYLKEIHSAPKESRTDNKNLPVI